MEKYSWKFDNIFDIAASGRDKPTRQNEEKTDNSNDNLMVFLVIFINHDLK